MKKKLTTVLTQGPTATTLPQPPSTLQERRTDVSGQRLTTNQGVPIGRHGVRTRRVAVLTADGIDGKPGVARLARCAETMDFIQQQYRHGKTILALGASQSLLDQAGISSFVRTDGDDAGIVRGTGSAVSKAANASIAALGKHRHPHREMLPHPTDTTH